MLIKKGVTHGRMATFEELLMSQVVHAEALTRLLVQKGIFSKEEFLEMVKVVDREIRGHLTRLSGFAGYYSQNPCKINPTIAKVFTTGSFVPRRPEPSHGGAADGVMTGATA